VQVLNRDDALTAPPRWRSPGLAAPDEFRIAPRGGRALADYGLAEPTAARAG
jgi:hypothetical protein